MHRSAPHLDRVGLGLAAAFLAWIGVAAAIHGGRPAPMAVLVVASIMAIVGARRISIVWPLAVPAVVALGPLIAAVMNRSGLLGSGPLGYVNASGALFFIAACAASLVALSARRRSARGIAYLVATVWILIPWWTGAFAAALLAALLPLALVLVQRPTAIRGALVGGLALALTGLGFAAVLGARYEPGGRGSVAHRVFDERLGESRVVLWSDAIELIRAQPFTGAGPGRFRETSPTALADRDLQWTHNEYLQMAAETGIPGGILLVLLLAWAFARLWPAATADLRSLPSIVALGAVALHANIDFILHFPAVPLALALLVGAGAAVPRETTVRPVPRLQRPARVAVASTVAFWFALWLPVELINPPPTAANGATWAEERGIHFVQPGVARSLGAPHALYRRLAEAHALTIEAWVATADVSQYGPANIISASGGRRHRNFTLAQHGHYLVFLLRTTRTTWNGSNPHLVVAGVFGTDELQHVVVATDLEETRVYVDGGLRWSGPGPGGLLDDWVHAYPLLLGNETDGSLPWLGEIRFLALYDRRLSDAEVERAYDAGPSRVPSSARFYPPPLAAYVFDLRSGGAGADRSDSGLGPGLEIPVRLRVPPRGFADTILEAGNWSVGRFGGHVLLFAVWAGLLLGLSRKHYPVGAAGVLVTAAGLTLAVAATAARYLEGRSPSLVDLSGAVTGCIIGIFAAAMMSRVYGSIIMARSRRIG